MELCYSDIRRFDDKLDLVLAGIGRIESWDTAERAALLAQIKVLVDAAAIAQADKDKLMAEFTKAFEKSEIAERKLRSAIPT